ncbi:MAG TPA: HD domain-containing phosphohydrolase [Geobacteraceae bacterium]|nr:HD domain-containing phosphohydrolase [Geobacteraceae bacterium]
MSRQINVPAFDIAMCLSHALDLVSPLVVNHHQRVAYIASCIAAEMGLTKADISDIVIAGMLHDAGAISLQDKLSILVFDMKSPHEHAERGFLFINTFEPFARIADMVRHHHVPWEKGKGTEFKERPVPMGSHILHLADRIDILIDRQQPVLGQVKKICRKIRSQAGRKFIPEQVDAFLRVAAKEYFWLDVASPSVGAMVAAKGRHGCGALSGIETLEGMARLISRVIDFRSRFTSVHSAGVAAIAEYLARLSNLPENTCRQVKIAGQLHDLGKLSVPKEILEKTAKLTVREHQTIRAHTFHTYRVLETVKGFEHISAWAAYHHERPDGTGYPFHIKGRKYSRCCRIVTVADVFAAITEDRPYRKGMSIRKALGVMARMAEKGELNGTLVAKVRENYRELNAVRNAAQADALREYGDFARIAEKER